MADESRRRAITTAPGKVLIFGDAHVAAHTHSASRLQHCLDALKWVFSVADERGVSDVIFLGDLFHDRKMIDIITYQRVYEVFESTQRDHPKRIWLLLGNHDMWHRERWDVSSVVPLRSIPGVTVVDRPCTLDVQGHPVSFLPYTHNPAADVAKIVNDAQHRILCGHVAVNGAVLNVMHGIRSDDHVEHDGDMTKIGPEAFDGWNQVFLGHYHAQQKVSPTVEYLGSPIQLSFGEAFQHKHVLVYDLKTHEKTYVRNTFSPTHLIIPRADLDKYDLDGNFIQVLVDDATSSDQSELNDTIRRNHSPASLKIKQAERKVEEDVGTVEVAKLALTKRAELIRQFIEAEERAGRLSTLDRERLIEIGERICTADAA